MMAWEPLWFGPDLRALAQTMGLAKGFQQKRCVKVRPEESRGVGQEKGGVAVGVQA